jgi:hypothetical protein
VPLRWNFAGVKVIVPSFDPSLALVDTRMRHVLKKKNKRKKKKKKKKKKFSNKQKDLVIIVSKVVSSHMPPNSDNVVGHHLPHGLLHSHLSHARKDPQPNLQRVSKLHNDPLFTQKQFKNLQPGAGLPGKIINKVFGIKIIIYS